MSRPSSAGRNGLIASTPAGCAASPERSANATASPAPCEKPPTIASERGKPNWAHVSSSVASSGVEHLGEHAGRHGGAHVVPRESGCARSRVRATRHHGGEHAVGVEVGEEAAEITLVGAVAVREEQHPASFGTGDQVGDERHARSSCGTQNQLTLKLSARRTTANHACASAEPNAFGDLARSWRCRRRSSARSRDSPTVLRQRRRASLPRPTGRGRPA